MEEKEWKKFIKDRKESGVKWIFQVLVLCLETTTVAEMPAGMVAGARLPRHASPRGVRRQQEVRINSMMPESRCKQLVHAKKLRETSPAQEPTSLLLPAPDRAQGNLGLLHGMPAPGLRLGMQMRCPLALCLCQGL